MTRSCDASCDYCGLPVAAAGAAGERQFCCFGCRFADSVMGQDADRSDVSGASLRLGLAIFFAMNVMVFTMFLWSQPERVTDPVAGVFYSVARYLCLLFSIPVVFLLAPALVQDALAGPGNRYRAASLLLLVGVTAALVYSVWSVVTEQGNVYFEVGVMVLVLVTLGRWLEAEGKRKTTQSLRELEQLLPDQVRRVTGGEMELVDRTSVQIGEQVQVVAGERIALDGRVVRGRAAVDEQMVTGESLPVEKGPGERVFSGTFNLDGELLIETTATASSGTWQRLVDSVLEAVQRRTAYQRLADTIAGWLLPLVLLVAVLTFVVHLLWWDGGWGATFPRALLAALAVLVIACPCALGMATPLTFWGAISRAARSQVLFRDGDALTRLAEAKVVCFDKTGTLTTGEFEFVDCWVAPEFAREDVFALAADLSARSQHPLAKAVRRRVAPRLAAETAERSGPLGRGATELRAERSGPLSPNAIAQQDAAVQIDSVAMALGGPRRRVAPRLAPETLSRGATELRADGTAERACYYPPASDAGSNTAPEYGVRGTEYSDDIPAASAMPLTHPAPRSGPLGRGATELRAELPGRGITAYSSAFDAPVLLGSARLLAESGCSDHSWQAAPQSQAWNQHALVFLGIGDRIAAVFAFGETLRPEAHAALHQLQAHGLTLRLLTGDRRERAAWIASELGITYHAELLPDDKLQMIEQLRREFGPVVMVGDGLNDAPALAAADVGIAMGCGADLSREAASVCLLGSSLDRVPWSFDLARETVRTLRWNLLWAFGYNAAAVPLAAIGWVNPIAAAVLMAASSVFVIGNSLKLGRSGPRSGPLSPNAIAQQSATSQTDFTAMALGERVRERGRPESDEALLPEGTQVVRPADNVRAVSGMALATGMESRPPHDIPAASAMPLTNPASHLAADDVSTTAPEYGVRGTEYSPERGRSGPLAPNAMAAHELPLATTSSAIALGERVRERGPERSAPDSEPTSLSRKSTEPPADGTAERACYDAGPNTPPASPPLPNPLPQRHRRDAFMFAQAGNGDGVGGEGTGAPHD